MLFTTVYEKVFHDSRLEKTRKNHSYKREVLQVSIHTVSNSQHSICLSFTRDTQQQLFSFCLFWVRGSLALMFFWRYSSKSCIVPCHSSSRLPVDSIFVWSNCSDFSVSSLQYLTRWDIFQKVFGGRNN